MLKIYFKIAIRNIFKQKVYSFINIAGLSIGMTCSLFLLLWVYDELSFNRFHQNAGTLFRVEQDQPTPQGDFHVNITPFPMGQALKEEIPEIANVSRYANPGILLLRYGKMVFFEENVAAVDPPFFKMFSFPLTAGNGDFLLSQPFSLVINEDIADKYFGGENPVGKTIVVNNNYPCTVTGVMRKIPRNSSILPSIVVPVEIMRKIGGYDDSWRSNEIVTWVELRDKTEAEIVGKKITDVALKHRLSLIQDVQIQKRYRKNPARFTLMGLPDLRLHAHFGYEQNRSNYQTIIMFLVMAMFILLIACINFMNLATARSVNRAKEVGMRKTIGATRSNIAFQFYSESMLMTSIALVISSFLVGSLLPLFNTMSGKQLPFNVIFSPGFLAVILSVTLITGLISGTYPALFLSNFQPIDALRSKLKSGRGGSLFRKILVVIQFSLSIILIMGTFVLYRQLEFMRTKGVGYDKEQLLYLPLRGDTPATYPVLKDELSKHPEILGVSGTYQEPMFMSANSAGADWEGKDPGFRPLIGYGVVDFDYVETMGIGMAEGRTFSRAYSTDTSRAVLVNEEVVKLMGVQSAVGKRFDFGGRQGIIIGVMKNYHYQPIQNTIEPLALFVSSYDLGYAIIRLQGGNTTGSLNMVRNSWEKVNPLYPFEYTFFDQDFSVMFQADENKGTIFRYSAIVAIMIACLGLFGLASFMVEQRRKEVGIRKVLGASVSGVTIMLSKEFMRWIVIANLIAAPVAYVFMEKILTNYAYRISVDWWMYAATAGLTLVIALFTVGYQSVKTALVNPAECLRYE